MRTSLYTILCILIRLGAVMLAVDTIITVPSAWSMVDPAGMPSGWDGVVVGFGVAALALAALLWIYPGVLARMAAGGSSQQVFESPISGAELQQIVLCAIGVWFAMGGVVDLMGLGVRLIVAAHMSTNVTFGEIVRHDLGRIVSVLVKVALGVALALGARGLVGVLRRVREQGLPPAAAAGEASDLHS